VYRSRYNIELDREFNSPNVIDVVKSNRLRWAHDKRCRKPMIRQTKPRQTEIQVDELLLR
jgi:hypothetical protein